ncbi:MAG: DUF5665 domain-containing protein [Clostridia bacterium]|jgi:hypothetical protein
MWIRKRLVEKLYQNIDNLNYLMTKNNIIDFAELLGNRKEMFLRNFFSGIFKGMGIGIGFTIITAIIIFILQKIIALNIPIIRTVCCRCYRCGSAK